MASPREFLEQVVLGRERLDLAGIERAQAILEAPPWLIAEHW
jgi:hypothetical protein